MLVPARRSLTDELTPTGLDALQRQHAAQRCVRDRSDLPYRPLITSIKRPERVRRPSVARRARRRTARQRSLPIGPLGTAFHKEKDWSQDQLAFHAQIDGRQVSRYENDRVVPSVEVIVIAGYFPYQLTEVFPPDQRKTEE